jgi:hypothetical protein
MITIIPLMRSAILCRYFDTAFNDAGVFGYLPDESEKSVPISWLIRTLWIS